MSREKRLLDWIGGVGLAIILGLVLFPVFAHGGNRPTISKACMSQLKQMALAMNVYADLNGDQLPDRDRWMDATQAYASKPGYFRDPEVKEKGQYGYSFNSRLSNQPRPAVANPAEVTMLFDSINLGRNASDPLNSFPKPGRHSKANCVSFLDCHVKRISDLKK